MSAPIKSVKKTAPSKTVGKTVADGDKKKVASKRHESFSTYIYKILRETHEKMGISSPAMAVMNSLVEDMFERIAKEASDLAKVNKKNTISAREISSATKLVLPGELARHAVSEGTKALTKFGSSGITE